MLVSRCGPFHRELYILAMKNALRESARALPRRLYVETAVISIAVAPWEKKNADDDGSCGTSQGPICMSTSAEHEKCGNYDGRKQARLRCHFYASPLSFLRNANPATTIVCFVMATRPRSSTPDVAFHNEVSPQVHRPDTYTRTCMRQGNEGFAQLTGANGTPDLHEHVSAAERLRQTLKKERHGDP